MILTKAGQTFADDKADVEIQEEYGAPAAPVIDSYGGPQAAPISRLFIIIIITILINYHYNPYQLSLSIIIIILINYPYQLLLSSLSLIIIMTINIKLNQRRQLWQPSRSSDS